MLIVPSVVATERSWNGPFRGEFHKLALNTISDFKSVTSNRGIYAYCTSVVQSSGMGKSRMMDEMAKYVVLIPVNLRPTDTGIIFPQMLLLKFSYTETRLSSRGKRVPRILYEPSGQAKGQRGPLLHPMRLLSDSLVPCNNGNLKKTLQGHYAPWNCIRVSTLSWKGHGVRLPRTKSTRFCFSSLSTFGRAGMLLQILPSSALLNSL